MTEPALTLLDVDGKVVGWLAGSEHLFGYRPEEILGQPLNLLFTPEDIALGIPEHELNVARGDGQSMDDRWQLRKDGARIWVSGVLLAIRGDAGEVRGFGKAMWNRTDQKARLETLENRITVLTKADERKCLFLGTLAHELRNPLAPLLNAVELIQMSVPETEDVGFALTLIRRQVQFMQRLVDDLLDVTRISTGKIQLKKELVDLQELLHRVAEICRPDIEEHRQELQVVLPSTPLIIEGDANRLQQVFVNLVNNAVKYTPQGGKIWIKATFEGEEAVIQVADTGIGISPEMLPRIFDLFTQEESARTKSPGGLGIGLALVKDLVTLHGGQVLVRSDGRNKGSEFTVRLPLR
jgi:PAS domain S-box-containing protein